MDVQTATVVVAGIGVIIAVINSIISSRRAEHLRQTQLFMELYNQWNTRDMAKQYGRVRYEHQMTADKWSQNIIAERDDGTWTLADPDIYADFQTLATFFEGIGVLVQRQLIDIDVVEDLLANRIIWWWDAFKPISELARQAQGDPKLHDHTEYLYNIMKLRQQT